jgi:serine phosphatase RsbU (regulator of sigma subunit)
MTSKHAQPDRRTMGCMEIRGGSQAIEERVAMPGLDLWVFSQPHEKAVSGGDVHYVSLCGGGIISRLIVADVSGHGEEVAEFSRSLRDLMRKHINTKAQTRLVTTLNRRFAALAELRRFATAVVATYLATNRTLTITNAGHPRPLLYRSDSASWSVLDGRDEGPGNLPLGLDDDTAYRQFTITLDPGDLVLFYTDALSEAADPSGAMIGEGGLVAMLQGINIDNFEKFGHILLDRLDGYRGGQPADDDVTVLALHHNAAGPRPPGIAEKVDVYAKFFGLKPV